ncbi:MAG: response regulator transcription factor [Campylobacterales bacterium]|nr:response regulator transcription factor [Campylobacterales bacterium]
MSLGDKKIKVLVIEDDEITRQAIVYGLKTKGVEIVEAENGIDGFELFLSSLPEIVITDIQLLGINGIELIKKIRKLNRDCRIIIITDSDSKDYILEAMELNILKYLLKPLDYRQFGNLMDKSIKEIEYEKDNPSLMLIKDDIFYNSYDGSIYKKDKVISILTHKEQLLFNELIKNRGRVITNHTIMNVLYYNRNVTECSIRTLIKKIRRKVGDLEIYNIRGFGYKLDL